MAACDLSASINLSIKDTVLGAAVLETYFVSLLTNTYAFNVESPGSLYAPISLSTWNRI